jgi:hypothetical protein
MTLFFTCQASAWYLAGGPAAYGLTKPVIWYI